MRLDYSPIHHWCFKVSLENQKLIHGHRDWYLVSVSLDYLRLIFKDEFNLRLIEDHNGQGICRADTLCSSGSDTEILIIPLKGRLRYAWRRGTLLSMYKRQIKP